MQPFKNSNKINLKLRLVSLGTNVINDWMAKLQELYKNKWQSDTQPWK